MTSGGDFVLTARLPSLNGHLHTLSHFKSKWETQPRIKLHIAYTELFNATQFATRYLHTMATSVRRAARAHPSLLLRDLNDLDFDRPTHINHVSTLALSPAPRAQISARARGEGAQEIDFGEELEVVSCFCWGGFHEVFSFLVEACDLEDVDDIVDIELC